MMVPYLPHRIAGAVVAYQHFGLADPEPPVRGARGKLPARLRDAADDGLVRDPRHVAPHLDPHVDDLQLREAVVAADQLPELGQLIDRPVGMPIEVVLQELVSRRKARAHARDVEIGVRSPPLVVDAFDFGDILFNGRHIRTPEP